MDENFPMGVRTTYRKYCQDNVVDVTVDPKASSSELGVCVTNLAIHDEPRNVPGQGKFTFYQHVNPLFWL